MTEDELWLALEGIEAYDSGCVDSGIHDEQLRQRMNQALDAMDTDQQRRFISIRVREAFLSDEALDQGYGWEDAAAFGDWFLNESRRGMR